MSKQLITILIYLISTIVLNSEIIVQTSQGILRGTIEKSRNGRNYSAFLGIPYGKPPVGDLRFRNPLPADKWKGIRQATFLGNRCIHTFFGIPFGKEDCLFLNVYTPFHKFQKRMNLNTTLLPIMVFIHGGLYFLGSGNDYKANYIMDKNVIFVTINYRLGIFGFLSTADSTAPGNFGMKDQVLALKWIQKNIQAFGGDKNRVTLVGHSAGGSSVHLHVLSKASNGLFHQYILQSGTALAGWAFRDKNDIFESVKKIAKYSMCPTKTTKSLINCLRETDANALLFWSNILGLVITIFQAPWVPTNEPNNKDAFLTDYPENLMNQMKDLPFISGVTENEGAFITNVFYAIDPLYNRLRKFMKKLFIDDAFYMRNAKKNFPANLDKFYFNNSHEIMKKDWEICEKIFSDGSFQYPEIKMLDQITPNIKNPTYFYHFIYRGETSTFSNFFSNDNFGASHGDDLLYLFPITYFIVNRRDTDLSNNSRKMSNLMIDLWTSFTTNGAPTSKYLDPPNLWKPYNTENNPYFQIGDKNDNTKLSVKLTNNFLTDRMNFWRENFFIILKLNMYFYTKLLYLQILRIIFIKTETLVQIKQGILNGTNKQTRSGKNYSAFLGIPYGQAPIDELRFSIPKPAKNWNGIRPANSFGNICPQIRNDTLVGNEDCLFLNVYTPFLNFQSQFNKKDLLPVMFWIHGGYFTRGSSNVYTARYFLDKSIILITINYRVGILGFLSTGDSIAPGNYGLKDQVLALKWVQENIKSFGGDPDRVTIFGESSGGVSVNLLAISRATNGLFHQYIIESGSALCPWAYQKRSSIVNHLKNISKIVNCSFNTSKIVIDCLRTKNVSELLNTTKNIFDAIAQMAQLTWTPTKEDDNEDAFLTDDPKNLIHEMKDLPFIVGVNVHEGLLVTANFFSNNLLFNILKLLHKSLIGFVANHYFGTNDKQGFIDAVNKFYFNNTLDSQLDKMKYLRAITNFITDGFFLYPTLRMLQKVTPYMKNSNYAYLFGYRGEFSTTITSTGDNRNIGVNHMDELIYLFPMDFISPELSHINLTEPDLFLSEVMIDFWTSFAIKGLPKSKKLKEPKIWKPYTTPNNTYLQIGNIRNNKDPRIKFSSPIFPERFKFWTENCPFLKEYQKN
ncbi:uncharacterized protein LOC127277391 [Leptopilina boulardi]|uniref:uncharacterized protein LOC127277391 n=1 Tax=Leptopilina boulardi TaxID=63433 RepID=UPI0021F63D0E|nr:uncharacterized protein LOC127277391 [Leptopilina boulardi]